MAKLKIYTFPDAVLAEKALPIERVEKSLRPLADDMLETMYDAPGVGLAANQVGILKRILVMDTEYDHDDSVEGEMHAGGEVVAGVLRNKKPIIVINPKIIHREGSILYKEGCLSVPDYCAEVKRSEKVKIEFQNIDGLTQVLSLEGLAAVCIQHEMDHLDGKLFIERLSPLKKNVVVKKLRRERAKEDEEDENPQSGRERKKSRKSE